MVRLIWSAALAAACMAGAPATAEGLSLGGGGGGAADRLGLASRVLDGRAAQQYAGSVRLAPGSAKPQIVAAVALPAYRGAYSGPYLPLARAAARRHGIPEDLFMRLVQQESGWNPSATSRKGAHGLAQLMPDTARLLGVDAADPEANLDGGARYLRRMYDRFGEWRLALAAYNAGPGAVEQHGGVPPYAETQGYVLAILGTP